MLDPGTQADSAAAAVLTAAAAAPASIILAGFDPYALLLSLGMAIGSTFLFGLVDTRMKAIGGILIATLLGGYGAPAVAELIVVYKPELRPAVEVGRPLVIMLLGLLSPVLLPGLVAGLKRRTDRLSGGEQ